MPLLYITYFVICLLCAWAFSKKKTTDHFIMALLLSCMITPLLGIPLYRILTP